MKFLSYLRAITTKFFHRSELENEMDEELQSHMQHRADALERGGLERTEAERRALIEFGKPRRRRPPHGASVAPKARPSWAGASPIRHAASQAAKKFQR